MSSKNSQWGLIIIIAIVLAAVVYNKQQGGTTTDATTPDVKAEAPKAKPAATARKAAPRQEEQERPLMLNERPRAVVKH